MFWGSMVKKNIVLTGLLAAMVFLTTAYVMHIPVGTGGGYIHLGDTMIYVAASLLPMPYAMAAAAIGGGLSDIISGAAIWAIPTVIIKSLMVLPFTAKAPKMLCVRNAVATGIAGVIGIVGYGIAGAVISMLSGSAWQAAVAASVASAMPNVVQETAGAVAFILLALAMDRLHVKQRLCRIADMH